MATVNELNPRRGFRPAISLIVAATSGAVLAHYLDPRLGHRRRVLLRDKFVRLSHSTRDLTNDVGKWIFYHGKGALIETAKLLSGQDTRGQRRFKQKASAGQHASHYDDVGMGPEIASRKTAGTKRKKQVNSDWDGEPIQLERSR